MFKMFKSNKIIPGLIPLGKMRPATEEERKSVRDYIEKNSTKTGINILNDVYDTVNKPSHYAQTKIECIDAIEACIEPYNDPIDSFLTAQVIKYIWRHPFKSNAKEDLRKARWYLDRLIQHYSKDKRS